MKYKNVENERKYPQNSSLNKMTVIQTLRRHVRSADVSSKAAIFDIPSFGL